MADDFVRFGRQQSIIYTTEQLQDEIKRDLNAKLSYHNRTISNFGIAEPNEVPADLALLSNKCVENIVFTDRSINQ